MPSFIRVRSPLLRALGGWSDPETPRILRRRRAAIGSIAVVLVALVLVMRAGRLPLPALDLLYVVHDYAVLPFWGYAWTFFAPYSITWWSVAGIGLVVWVATFLTRRSAVRGLHAHLCRLVVIRLVGDSGRSSRHVARLTAWVDWLAARTLGAELLTDVVRLEQTETLAAIVAGGSTLDERTAWRLVRLTDLLARLTSCAGAPPRARWKALAVWHQTLMWVDRRAGTDPRAVSAPALFAALGATGRWLLDRLEEGDDVDGDTLSNGLRRDLAQLVEYADGHAARFARSPNYAARQVTPSPLPDTERSGCPDVFVRSVLERLDALWGLAEHGSNDAEPPTLTAKAPDEVLEMQGYLVSSLGLHAASLIDDAHLAAGYLQAFEALSFVRYLGVAGREGNRVARALTAEAPARDHYRLVADIAERHRARRATGPTLGGAVLDEAARHERMRIDGLHDAAGQDFAPASPETFRTTSRPEPADRRSRRSAQRDSGRDLRSRLRRRIRERPLPLRRRIDPVLLGGLAAAIVVYGAAAAALVLLIESAYTPGWSARPLPDRRLLENVRRGLDRAPFLDAIFHAPDRQLVVSQAGGVFHSYDPATRLWSTVRPFGPNDLARPDIRLLASSSDRNSAALWGVTLDGGLVRRLNGRWEVVVGDTKFLGRRGMLIQQAELSAVAASPDGKWLLAAAGGEGVGLQDLERRRWLSRDEISQEEIPSVVTHAVWWRDRFYVGGSEGVSELALDRASTGPGAGTPLVFRRVKGLEGAVVSIEATAAEGLFVLATVRCENGPAACVRLSRVPQPFAPPDLLIDERNRYTELSLDRMFYAVQWKEHLLLAGGSGIFDYDTRVHAWKRQATETISAIGPCASSSCFYYGYGGRSSGVALFTPKTMTGEAPTRWSLAGEQPTRIAAEAPDKAAVLTAAGRAYSLGAGSVSTLINPATSSPVPLDRYRGAATFGDKVLFFGTPGAVLHDVVRRSYSSLQGTPPWLRSPSSIVAASGAFLFGLEARGESYEAHVVPQRQVELGTLFFNTAKPFSIDGPIRAVDASSPDLLRVIDGKGRIQSIAASGVTPLTGGRLPSLARAPLLDVAGTDDLLGAATVEGVRLYSMRTRSWSDPLPAPEDERPVEIAERNGSWIARSDAHRLVTIGDRPSVLIGGGDVMPRRPPSDVFQAGTEIYLAWAGTIQRYDSRSRRVTASWTFNAAGPATLAGVIGSEPLSLAGGVVRIGAREIARNVHNMFTRGSNLWLTREEGGKQHVEARPLESLVPHYGAHKTQLSIDPFIDAMADRTRIPLFTHLLEPRIVAESGPLRLTRGAGGAVEGALRVTDVQGRLSWMPIDFSTGRFPFDVVRSVAVIGNTLYVGTDAGLQVYDGADVALDRARLIALASNASPAPPTVDRVGESCAAPGTPVACGPRGCVRQLAAAFVDAPADTLSCRLRARSPFWSWQVDAAGLSGRYVVTPVRSTLVSEPPVMLTDGQLSHDAVSQVVASGGSTFTVWQGRYVGVHSAGLGLAGARNDAFDLPVRLVNVTAPVPMLRSRERDLSPGLYAIEGPGSRMWRYENQGWTIVTDGAETAAIADCAVTPPLLQRRRLRLVHHATRPAPSFEMRMPGGAWTPLEWDGSANRYALDVWQDIAVNRQTLWTATPAGLVSRDRNWSFDPDTFRVVAAPSTEAGRSATDLRVDGGVADLRYDGARAYRISLDGGAPGRAVRLSHDPFADKAFDVATTYWAWRITGNAGASAGRLAGTWNGEPIAVANGRFDFDAVNSMAVFQGRLHIATSTRGWFALPIDSAALERRARPRHVSVSPLDVTKLYANQDPDEPELCLQGVDGQFTRLSTGGASRRTQGCPVLAARTGFWRYTRDGSTLRVLPGAGAARPGERRLVDGRFTDEVITGAPVSGTKNAHTYTLVPTAAAVMWWDSAGHAADMHAPPFQGKPGVPRLLQWTADGSPAYVADGTLYSLEQDDKPRASWTVRLPPTAVFERIASGPGPLLSIDWSDDGRRHHTVVDPRNGSVSHDDIPIDARGIPAYFQRAMTEDSRDGLIRLRLRDHVVSAFAAGQGWPIVQADDAFQLLAGASYGTRAILIGPRHLIEVNMERVARAVYSGASPPAAPGPEKKK